MELSEISGLRDKNLRAQGLFVAEGRLLVERTLSSGLDVLAVWAASSAEADARDLLARHSVKRLDSGFRAVPELRVCSDEEISDVAGFPFHRGMFALATRPLVDMIDEKKITGGTGSSINRRILVLPAITDPGNLGTLLRSALAFGFSSVWLGRETCDPFNRKALRSSMGATLSLDLHYAESASLSFVSGAGLPIYAAAIEDDALVAGRALSSGGCALVLGNEHDGISGEWRNRCTETLMVPVSTAVDSLNVAIAGSILMWSLSGM